MVQNVEFFKLLELIKIVFICTGMKASLGKVLSYARLGKVGLG
jgi:hypothetical protein